MRLLRSLYPARVGLAITAQQRTAGCAGIRLIVVGQDDRGKTGMQPFAILDQLDLVVIGARIRGCVRNRDGDALFGRIALEAHPRGGNVSTNFVNGGLLAQLGVAK